MPATGTAISAPTNPSACTPSVMAMSTSSGSNTHGPTHHQRLHQIALGQLHDEKEGYHLQRLERIDRDEGHHDGDRTADPGAEIGNDLQQTSEDTKQQRIGDTKQRQPQRGEGANEQHRDECPAHPAAERASQV